MEKPMEKHMDKKPIEKKKPMEKKTYGKHGKYEKHMEKKNIWKKKWKIWKKKPMDNNKNLLNKKPIEKKNI